MEDQSATAVHRAHRRKVLLISIAPILGVIIIILLLGWLRFSTTDDQGSLTQIENTQPVNEVSLEELSQLDPETELKINNANQLVINGELKANQAFVIAPGQEPSDPSAGQLFYDTDINRFRYYDGQDFQTIPIIPDDEDICFVGADCGFLTAADLPTGLSLPQPLGVNASPTFAGLTITNDINVSSGGTGRSSFANNALLVGNGSGDIQVTNTPVSGQIIVADGSGQPRFVGMSGDVTINSSGLTTLAPNTVGATELTSTGVAAGAYGNGSSYPVITVDADGRITNVSTQAIGGGGAGVTSLNTLAGGLTIQGTANQISISDNGTETITLSLPQDIASTSSPTFAGLNLSANLIVNGSTTLGDAIADQLTINGTIQGGAPFTFEGATADGFETTIVITDPTQDNTITLPNQSGTICLNSGNCAAAGAAGGDLDGSYPNPTVVGLNGTSLNTSGLAGGDVLMFDGTDWVNQQITGDVAINNLGVAVIQPDSVDLGTDTTGDYLESLSSGAGTGISVAGGTGEGATPSISLIACNNGEILKYSAGAWACDTDAGAGGFTAVDSLNSLSGDLNLQGTANQISVSDNGSDTITLSLPQNIATTSSPTFGGLTLNGDLVANGNATLGDSAADTLTINATLQGANPLVFEGATADANDITLAIADPTAAITYRFANAAGGVYDICTTAGNCVGGSGGAPNASQYVTLTADATLTNERVLTQGSNISIADAGANSTVTINVVSNPTFSGLVTANGGLTATGSLTLSGAEIMGATPLVFEGVTADGFETSLAVEDPTADITYRFRNPAGGAGTYDICTTDGNCIGGGGGGAPDNAQYLVLSLNGNLSAERALLVGAGLSGADAGANNNYTLAVNVDSATIGINGSDQLYVMDGGITSTQVQDGSLTGTDIQDGSITGDDIQDDSIALNTDTSGNYLESLSSGAGTGISVSGGTGEGATPSISLIACNDGEILKYNSGSWACDTDAGSGSSGVDSLNSLTGALNLQGTTDQITVSDNGSDTITLSLPQDIATTSNPTFSGMTLNGSLTANANVTVGDAATDTLTINATLQGANPLVFEGATIDANDITLAIADPTAAITYRFADAAGGVYDICTSAGNCIGGGGGSAPNAAQYVTLAADATLTNERVLTQGSNISIADAGANSSVTINVVNNPTFSGLVTANGGLTATGSITLSGAEIMGASPLVFEGATANGFETTLAVEDPTADVTYRFRNPAGGAGTYDICTTDGNCVGGGASAPDSAQYLVLALNGNLSAERALVAGAGLGGTDAGANGNYTLVVNVDSATIGINGSDQLYVLDDGITSQQIDDGTITGTDIATGTVTGGNIQDGSVTGTDIQDDSIALGTDTSGNYLQSLSSGAGTGISVTGGTGEGATPSISLIACNNGEILKYNGGAWACDTDSTDDVDVASLNSLTGGLTLQGTTNQITVSDNGSDTITLSLPQDIASTSTPTFGGITVNGTMLANGNVTLGDAGTDTLTINATLQGANPFVFEGAVADGNELTFAITNPSADQIITFPDETGTVCLTSGNCLGGGGGGAPSGAQYLTLALDGNLSAERVLQGGSGIGITDGGANGNATLQLSALTSNWDQSGAFDIILNNAGSELVILESAGDTFSATLDAGDLTSNRTFTLGDNGGEICTTAGNCVGGGGGGAAPNDATFLTLSLDADLLSERVLVGGSALALADGGANTTLTIDVNVDSSTIGVNGSDQLYVRNDGITTTQIDDLTITGTDIANDTIALGTKTTGNYLTSLTSGAGTGISITGGTGEGATPSISLVACNDGEILKYNSGSWACDTDAGAGGGGVDSLNSLSGALNLQGTSNQVSISDNGTDTITLSLPQDIATTSSPTFGGLTLNGALVANGNATLGDAATDTLTINATLQGANPLVFEGATADANDITLAIADPTAAITYRFADAAGGVYDICTSAGNCIGAGGGAAPEDAQYVTLALNGNLSNERVLTQGTNISLTDGGANGNITVNVANAPTFSGLVTSAGLTSSGTITFSGLTSCATVQTNGSGVLSCGVATESQWTDTGTLLHPADLSGAEDVAIGGTTTGTADILLQANGAAVFNEQGADADFRVESDTIANALFVQGSDGFVGIGTGSPSGRLHIQQPFGSSPLNVYLTGSNGEGPEDTWNLNLATNGLLSFINQGSTRFSISPTGLITNNAPTRFNDYISTNNGTLELRGGGSQASTLSLASNGGVGGTQTWNIAAQLFSGPLAFINDGSTRFSISTDGVTNFTNYVRGVSGTFEVRASGSQNASLALTSNNGANNPNETWIIRAQTFSGPLSIINDSNTFLSLNTSGALTIQGGSATLGTSSQLGTLSLYDGSSQTAGITTANQSANRTFTIPTTTSNDTFCLVTLANCAGSGISGTGSTGQVAFWNGVSSVTGENNFYWDSTNDRLGIGTNAPAGDVSAAVGASSSFSTFGSSTAANAFVIQGASGTNYYNGGIVWAPTADTSVPAAGIFAHYNGADDVELLLGTSNNFATGVTSLITINKDGEFAGSTTFDRALSTSSIAQASQDVANAAINIQGGATGSNYYNGGIQFSTPNNNPTKSKAAIFVRHVAADNTELILGTSNDWATGTNSYVTINNDGEFAGTTTLDRNYATSNEALVSQDVAYAALNIQGGDSGPNYYNSGIQFSTPNDNPTKSKAAIYVHHNGTDDTELILATSNDWLTGATSKVVIDKDANLSVQGSNISIGGATQLGTLNLFDGSSHTAGITTANQSANRTFTIPATTGNDTICLENHGNCSGSGEWTDTGTLLHPTDNSGADDSIAIGGNTVGTADILLSATGAAIFNQQGADADFRIEGVGDANLLFADASADFIGIGTNSPTEKLDVRAGNVKLSQGNVSNNQIFNSGDIILQASYDSNSGITLTQATRTISIRNVITNQSGDYKLALLDDTGTEFISFAGDVSQQARILTGGGQLEVFASNFKLGVGGVTNNQIINSPDVILQASYDSNSGITLTQATRTISIRNVITNQSGDYKLALLDDTGTEFISFAGDSSAATLNTGGQLELPSSNLKFSSGNVTNNTQLNSPSIILEGSYDSNGGITLTQARRKVSLINIITSSGAGEYRLAVRDDSDVEFITFEGDTQRLGIGDTSPSAALTVGNGDLFQVNASGAIQAATGITSSGTITFSGLASCSSLQTNGSGVLSCGSAGSSEWTDTGTLLHPTDNSGADDSITIGGTTAGTADIFFSTTGAAVFNEQGADADFRVESSGQANALFVQGSDGNVGIGTGSPDGIFEINGSRSQAAWGTNGVQLQVNTGTFTNTSTAMGGTAASAMFNSFAAPTLSATNTGVTTTNAATVYIQGAPTAGTNQTITNSYALFIDGGNSRFDGDVALTSNNAPDNQGVPSPSLILQGSVDTNYGIGYTPQSRSISLKVETVYAQATSYRLAVVDNDGDEFISFASNSSNEAQIISPAGTVEYFDTNVRLRSVAAADNQNLSSPNLELQGWVDTDLGTGTNIVSRSINLRVDTSYPSGDYQLSLVDNEGDVFGSFQSYNTNDLRIQAGSEVEIFDTNTKLRGPTAGDNDQFTSPDLIFQGSVDTNLGTGTTIVDRAISLRLNTTYPSGDYRLSVLDNAGTEFANFDGGNQRLNLGQASLVNGNLTLLNSTNAFGISLTAASQTTGSATVSFPDTAGANDTFCLVSLANCAGSGISGTGSAGQVAFWDGASSVTGSNQLFWDTTNSRLGIGTATPGRELHVVGSGSSSIGIDSGSNDTLVLGTNGVQGEIIFGSGYSTNNIHVDNTGDLTFLFGAGEDERLRIANDGTTTLDGDFLPSTDDTYDLGSSSFRWQDLYLGPASLHIGTDGNEGVLGFNTTGQQFEFDTKAEITEQLTIQGIASQVDSLFQLLDNNGNVNASFDETGANLTLGRIADSGTVTQGTLTLADGTTSNFGATLQSGILTADQTYYLPDATGTVALTLGSGGGGSQKFDFTGTEQQWVVPAGVEQINVRIAGASGGDGASSSGQGGEGGDGSIVETAIDVTPGETIYLYIGGTTSTISGGWNGGGDGYGRARGGGGSTDIRLGGNALVDRVSIAAGGGGGGGGSGANQNDGGDGGYGGDPNGLSGTNGSSGSGGGGGTLVAGGTAGTQSDGTSATDGALGVGGNGGTGNSGGGGGGGGGLYGGGGGGAGGTDTGNSGAGGGGGSSLVPAGGSVEIGNDGYGFAEISWTGSGTNNIIPVFGNNNTLLDSFLSQDIDTVTASSKFEIIVPESDSTTAGTLQGATVSVTDTGIVTSGTDTTYGQAINVTRTGATGGTINTTGLNISVTGDSGGTSTTTGLNVSVSGADNNYAALFSGGTVGIGTIAPDARLHVVNGSSGVAFRVNNSTSTGNIAEFEDNGTDVLTIADGGAVTLRNESNSTSALAIQRSTGSDTLFTADTSNNRIKIGNSTGTGGNTTLLVVDSATSDPSGVAGAIYYDSDDNKFRCYTTTWTDCAGGGSASQVEILSPEFAGAILSADGSNNTGSMTADRVTGLSGAEGEKHNYYEWSTAQGTAQDYDIAINIPVPSDFSSIGAASTFKFWMYDDDGATTNSQITWTVLDHDETQCFSTTFNGTSADTWEEKSASSLGSCAFSAGDIMTFVFKLETTSGAGVIRLGEVEWGFDK